MDFPRPKMTLASGPLFDLDELAEWDSSTLRRGPGRPSRGTTHDLLGGRFRLDTILDSGSFADVFRAEDLSAPEPGRAVAIKILRDPDSESDICYFDRELEILCRKLPPHPNVVPVLAHGLDEHGCPWYAMPLAVGTLLDEINSEEPADDRIIGIMRQVSAGLAHIHAHGVLHRDLSPRNVLRMDTGELAISDFGLARADPSSPTATVGIIGTRCYASPEVCAGAKAAITSEVFALGKLLLHLGTGHQPDAGIPENSFLPNGLFREIIRRATEPRPADRYPSVLDLLNDLEASYAREAARRESPADTLRRLRESLRSGNPPTRTALLELVQAALGPAKEEVFRLNQSHQDSLPDLIAYLSAEAIQILWECDPDAFRRLIEAYGTYVSGVGRFFAFDFCDVIADFFARAAAVTKDTVVLLHAVAALPSLGANHNRWHVRAVFLGLLQRVRTYDEAEAVIAALAQVDAENLKWSLATFRVSTVAEPLRGPLGDTLEDLLDQDPVVLSWLRDGV
jgi:serine/threonine protein kinase